MQKYEEMKRNLATGWNTWNSRSVLSHVLLPEGFALNLGIKEYRLGHYLKEALIGRFGESDEKIHPIAHAYDGSYTELNLKWQDIELSISSAIEENDLVILVTPLVSQKYPTTLVVESGILWNRKGSLELNNDVLTVNLPNKTINTYITEPLNFDPLIAIQTPCLTVQLLGETGISTGKRRTVEAIKQIIQNSKNMHEARKQSYGELSEAYSAMQNCMAWDTIYEPKKDRVVSTVSRLWNNWYGGYALFCWDTYFAAYMASLDSKELAYSNLVEITREKTKDGFVPNFAFGNGLSSFDRSQPPVGSFTALQIYKKFKEKWILEEVFEDLYQWNTWYQNFRTYEDGTLAWGSNPYTGFCDHPFETMGLNQTFGGALESGLDNSPMYDDVVFDEEKHLMKLSDVGLTSLYILDCDCLIQIAEILGKNHESETLKKRKERTDQGLQGLWDDEFGLFLNKHTDTGVFSKRISPTNFYALFSENVRPEQAERMLNEHFYNPEEFWGDWIMPAIARNDPGYQDQTYWRGRIWAPTNFLVYLGFKKHHLTKAEKDLAEKSKALILKEWLEHGHVHENYCGDTGEGCNKDNSDKFYHWGGLLSLIALIEEGYVEL